VKRACAGLLATLLAVAGCAVGPNYRRPDLTLPGAHRGDVGPVEAASLADLPWWDVFGCPALRALVVEALESNYDLEAAIARVEQARALIGVARSDVFPQIGYDAEAFREKAFSPGAPTNIQFNSFLGAFNLAWEIDIWGRIRRATEAARAEYLAAEAFRRGVLLSLVSDVAQAYFELLELDLELAIARYTTESFQRTLDLFSRRYRGGASSKLDVARAEAALAQTAATIPDLERLIVLKENQLRVLLGRAPGPIARGAQLIDQEVPPTTPAGLPSQLLERRPDVQQAEQLMVAANADVGVAVANFFPRLGLTAVYGGQTSELENLLKGSANIWAFGGALAGPIFQGGRLLEGYRASDAAWEAARAEWTGVVLRSLQEVSNTLTTQTELVGVRREQTRAVDALRLSVRLSLLRYDTGLANYFEVLEAQQQLFPAEIDLARTRRDQLVAVVVLYRALGGGWQLGDDAWTAAPPPPVPIDVAPSVEAPDGATAPVGDDPFGAPDPIPADVR
jgi:multidrug efflux system outer membrane protein